MIVAIQGKTGSFHEQAATVFFDEPKVQNCVDFEAVFAAVASGEADFGVVAIENSLYGSIKQTYDLLQDKQPWIIGEVYLHIRMQLLGQLGTKLDSITDVYSQLPALDQSQQYLKQHVPQAEHHEWFDTAASAEHVAALDDPTAAAIASQAAAETYGLSVIAADIEDNPNNYTRFVVIQQAKQQPTITDTKTSAIIRTDHSSGALHHALGAFADNGISLDRIESRAIPGPDRNYLFYIDFLASIESPAGKAALQRLAELNVSVTILGSYHGKAPVFS